MTFPGIIYLAAGAIDVITKEDIYMVLIFLEGLCLLVLPIFFHDREEKLKKQFPTKLIAPAYLIGYAVIVPVLVFITDSLDMYKLFGHYFLAGISLTIMLIILAGGFVWAVVIRVITAIVNAVKKR